MSSNFIVVHFDSYDASLLKAHIRSYIDSRASPTALSSRPSWGTDPRSWNMVVIRLPSDAQERCYRGASTADRHFGLQKM